MEIKKTYPIKVVSVKTGLSIHVIRVWEKRYKAIVPDRTETNRRLYTEADIQKLLLLKQAIQQGYNIGSVAGFSITELKELVTKNLSGLTKPDKLSEAGEREVIEYINDCLLAIKNFNARGFEQTLLNASLQLSQPVFIEKMIVPLVYRIGELWHGGELRIMHEHMATAVIKTFLENMRNNYRIDENAPAIIATTPVGQLHELGALILSLVAAADGWNVTYLGPNLPADEIAAAVVEKKASAVMLSIVYPSDDYNLKQDLLKLKEILPTGTSIIVGGRLVKNYAVEFTRIEASIVEDLAGFRKISAELKTK